MLEFKSLDARPRELPPQPDLLLNEQRERRLDLRQGRAPDEGRAEQVEP